MKRTLSPGTGHRFFIILSILLGGLATVCRAQDTILTVNYNSTLDSLNSATLSQKRFIQVFTPTGYKAGSADKYDVLYVLDGGNWNAGLIRQIQRFIEGEGHMPPTIIVSVMGIDRNIELTPTQLATWNAPSGGAAKFLGFIKNELIPYVNKNYPSNGDNTIWGHSLGGMFVLYALVNESATFKSYIAVDPSVWWDSSYVATMAAGKLPLLTGSNITLFISGRDGDELHDMGIDTMEAVLKRAAPANIKWKVVAYPGETHSSVRLKSTYDALRFTYAGYTTKIDFAPMGGIVEKGKPFRVWYFDDTTGIRYTADGTVPTETSPAAQREIQVTGPATVIYKRFTNRGKYDVMTSGNFTTEKMSPPVSKPKTSKPGGFNYSYYEGDAEKWPDLNTLTPLKTGIAGKDFEKSLPRKNNYALAIDGFLEIKEEGYYAFFVQAGKGSKLSVGQKMLVKGDDSTGRSIFTYLLPLKKGFYPLHLEYFDKKDTYNLMYYYVTPATMADADARPVPDERQYSNGKK